MNRTLDVFIFDIDTFICCKMHLGSHGYCHEDNNINGLINNINYYEDYLIKILQELTSYLVELSDRPSKCLLITPNGSGCNKTFLNILNKLFIKFLNNNYKTIYPSSGHSYYEFITILAQLYTFWETNKVKCIFSINNYRLLKIINQCMNVKAPNNCQTVEARSTCLYNRLASGSFNIEKIILIYCCNTIKKRDCLGNIVANCTSSGCKNKCVSIFKKIRF